LMTKWPDVIRISGSASDNHGLNERNGIVISAIAEMVHVPYLRATRVLNVDLRVRSSPSSTATK